MTSAYILSIPEPTFFCNDMDVEVDLPMTGSF